MISQTATVTVSNTTVKNTINNIDTLVSDDCDSSPIDDDWKPSSDEDDIEIPSSLIEQQKPSSSDDDVESRVEQAPPPAKIPRIHKENLIVTNQDIVVDLVDHTDEEDVCDPATCVDCTALPYPEIPEIGSDCVVIYGGPGSGKTECIKNIRKKRGKTVIIRDTDHLKSGQKVPANSVLFTNRHDIFNKYHGGLKIAFLPFRRHWLRQCLEKCPDTKDSWYDDTVGNIRRSLVIRRNCYLSDCILFSA